MLPKRHHKYLGPRGMIRGSAALRYTPEAGDPVLVADLIAMNDTGYSEVMLLLHCLDGGGNNKFKLRLVAEKWG